MPTTRIALAAALVACAAASTPTSPTQAAPATPAAASKAPLTTELDKQVIRKLYEDCINQGKLALVRELIADDYVGPGGARGPDGFVTVLGALRTGLSDIKFTLEDLIAEDNRVVVRWSWRATHDGTLISPLGKFPATGKQVTTTGMTIYQLVNHKIVRTWNEPDRLGVLMQIGAVSADPPAAARK